MASNFRKAKIRGREVAGLWVSHAKACPAVRDDAERCRCQPSYRAKRRHPITGKPEWGPTRKDSNEALNWKTGGDAVREVVRERRAEGPTFGALALQWWRGVESGTIGKRKGKKGNGYSATTLQGYSRSLRYVLAPLAFHEDGNAPAPSDFENVGAVQLDEQAWQAWVDRLAREGLSRSRIANHLAVVSAIYGWASRSTRRIVPRNPTLAVELPPNDEQPRERVATADEAALLLAALAEDDAVPYALAFYAGLRRSEIQRLDFEDVDLTGLAITVRRSKSDAGTGRRLPLAAPLKPILRAAWMRKGQPERGKVSRSVMAGKLAERARKAWAAARPEPLTPIGLHECRHTYASLLVAAGYTLKEVMEYMGHADLQTTSRYVKRLPQPNEENAADRLNAYLAGGVG